MNKLKLLFYFFDIDISIITSAIINRGGSRMDIIGKIETKIKKNKHTVYLTYYSF